MSMDKAEIGEREKFSSGGNTRWLILRGQWGVKLDRHIVRWTGFSVVTWQYAKAQRRPYRHVLLLTTTGARSGQARRSVLPYYEWEGMFVIVGSNGGGPKDPNWVFNIRADPRCRIRVKGRERPVSARVAAGDERERVLAAISRAEPFVLSYDAETRRNGRELPLVILAPAAP
jgi:deazaflavin-dependent oxidoreductase (nitroreductase family)